MIILDTNVISEAIDNVADASVVAWLNTVPITSLWVTSVTVFELQSGVAFLPQGRKREQLQEAITWVLQEWLANRIAPFDTASAMAAAILAAERRRRGRNIEIRDTMIAGIAIARGATLATRNIRHFDDLPVAVVNPWAILLR